MSTVCTREVVAVTKRQKALALGVTAAVAVAAVVVVVAIRSRGEAGGEYILSAPGGASHVAIAATEEVLEEMQRAGSDRAIAALVVGGAGFVVQEGTEVTVIGAKEWKKKVVVTDGPMAGRTGWVPRAWLVVPYKEGGR